jgi:hypothetical protein
VVFEVIKKNLDRGIAEGLYKEDIHTQALARFRIASIFLLFNPELMPHGNYSASQLLQVITDNYLCGIASAKGLKIIQKYKLQKIKQQL